jgi:hypothetical protein
MLPFVGTRRDLTVDVDVLCSQTFPSQAMRRSHLVRVRVSRKYPLLRIVTEHVGQIFRPDAH